jgi:transcription elongation factor GreA
VLEKMLRNAEVIDEEELDKNSINVGNRVRVLDVEFNEELEYVIVGSAEADPANSRISNESPLGHALLGHIAGDTVSVDAPDGMIEYKILEIK